MKTSNITYSRSQKIWSWVALIGIFVCGIMAGGVIWKNKQKIVAHEALTSCQMREKALKAQLIADIEDSYYAAYQQHETNAHVYDELVRAGCSENVEQYSELRDAEWGVAEVLRKYQNKNETDKPCQVIEKSLLEEFANGNCGSDPECHSAQAEVYAKIAENGCPENAEKYARKALDELQIAQGVRVDDSSVGENDMRQTVSVYKKLQMQNEAKKYIKKMEKLVNPGVDFILELQRVIEE